MYTKELGKVKMQNKSKYFCIMAGLMTASTILYGLYDRYNFIVTNYEVQGRGVKNPFRIVLLSDLHNQEYGRDNERLLKAINKAKPDIVLFAGDMIDHVAKSDEYASFLTLCAKLSRRYPVYYCFGNHELGNDNVLKIESLVEEAGVKLVNHKQYNININGNRLSISGITHKAEASDKLVRKRKAYLNRVLFNRERYRILIYHYPERAMNTIPDVQADLIVSGHAHGGQWRFFNKGLYAPGQGIFPKYTSGIHKVGSADMVISRGIGSHILMPRVNNPAEVVIIDVKEDN